jgi:hypothetical protein
MYGKFFASTFTGSMFGSGTDVFALWGYIIASANAGVIEVNPVFVGAVLGTTPDRINTALAVLCSPDPKSRTEAEDGRRLVHEGAYQYRVVNHAQYRAIRNEEDRREYNREAKRRERAKRAAVSTNVIPNVNDCQACQPIQKQSQKQKQKHIQKQEHVHTSGEESTALVPSPPKTQRLRRTSVFVDDGFAAFWSAYPRKSGKGAAETVWVKLRPSPDLCRTIVQAVEVQRTCRQWQKDGGQFIPYPSTWLHQRRWDDECEPEVSQVDYVSDVSKQNMRNAQGAMELLDARDRQRMLEAEHE